MSDKEFNAVVEGILGNVAKLAAGAAIKLIGGNPGVLKNKNVAQQTQTSKGGEEKPDGEDEPEVTSASVSNTLDKPQPSQAMNNNDPNFKNKINTSSIPNITKKLQKPQASNDNTTNIGEDNMSNDLIAAFLKLQEDKTGNIFEASKRLLKEKQPKTNTEVPEVQNGVKGGLDKDGPAAMESVEHIEERNAENKEKKKKVIPSDKREKNSVNDKFDARQFSSDVRKLNKEEAVVEAVSRERMNLATRTKDERDAAKEWDNPSLRKVDSKSSYSPTSSAADVVKKMRAKLKEDTVEEGKVDPAMLAAMAKHTGAPKKIATGTVTVDPKDWKKAATGKIDKVEGGAARADDTRTHGMSATFKGTYAGTKAKGNLKKEEVEVVEEEKKDIEYVTIHAPGNRHHGRKARVFHRFDDGRVNAQLNTTNGFGRRAALNLTLKPHEYQEVKKLGESVENIEEVKNVAEAGPEDLIKSAEKHMSSMNWNRPFSRPSTNHAVKMHALKRSMNDPAEQARKAAGQKVVNDTINSDKFKQSAQHAGEVLAKNHYNDPKFRKEEVEELDEKSKSLGSAIKKYKFWNKSSFDNGDPRNVKDRLNKMTDTEKSEIANREGKLTGPAELQRRLAKNSVKEEVKELEEKNWIKGAIKHPGALHKELGVPEGEKIPAGKLEKASHAGGKEGQRARLAITLKHMHHENISFTDEELEHFDKVMNSVEDNNE